MSLRTSGTAFEVVVPSAPVVLSAGQAKALFTAVNSTGRPVRAAANVEPVGQTPARWFSLAPPLAELAPGASAAFAVTITVPAGTAAGQYSFQLMVAAQDNPDDDYAVSDLVTFEVAAEKPKPPFPWLLVGGIAAGAVVVVVAGILVWLFTIGPLSAPDMGVSPSALDLGTVNQFAPTDVGAVTITNNGPTDLKISSFQFTGANFGGGKSNCVGAAIHTGQRCSVLVTLTATAFPPSPQPVSGTLVITSNAKGGPRTVPLTGRQVNSIIIF